MLKATKSYSAHEDQDVTAQDYEDLDFSWVEYEENNQGNGFEEVKEQLSAEHKSEDSQVKLIMEVFQSEIDYEIAAEAILWNKGDTDKIILEFSENFQSASLKYRNLAHKRKEAKEAELEQIKNQQELEEEVKHEEEKVQEPSDSEANYYIQNETSHDQEEKNIEVHESVTCPFCN